MRETSLKLLFAAVLFLVVLIGKEHSTPPALRGRAAAVSNVPQESTFTNLSAPERTESPSPIPPPGEEGQRGGDSSASPETKPVEASGAPAPRLPEKPHAGLYLVSFLDADATIDALDADRRWPIASITKLMTAIVAEERLTPATLIRITPEAEATEGTAGGFKGGETYSESDLIKALLLVSSNDAAIALADHVGYGAFLTSMNAKAAEIGMQNTYFKEPSGLSVVNQSTLRDLKLLMAYMLRTHPDLLALTRLPQAEIREEVTRARRTLVNINQFAGREDFIGGKTGFTDDSGENLVSLFSRQGRVLFVGVFDAQDRFLETERALAMFDAH